jgi:hypothetical protein
LQLVNLLGNTSEKPIAKAQKPIVDPVEPKSVIPSRITPYGAPPLVTMTQAREHSEESEEPSQLVAAPVTSDNTKALDPIHDSRGHGPVIHSGVVPVPYIASTAQAREPTDEELLACMDSMPSKKECLGPMNNQKHDPRMQFKDIELLDGKNNQERIKPLGAVRCVRLVVLDVIDNPDNRTKNIICFIASSPTARYVYSSSVIYS